MQYSLYQRSRLMEELTDYLNMYRYHHGIPGFVVNIVSRNEIVYCQGFGMTSLDSHRTLVNGDTVFSIQHVTKSFTAMALIHLEENTDFSLDVPIIEYLPYFRTKSGAYDKITTRHILSHTAGFPETVLVTSLLDKELLDFVQDIPEYQSIFKKRPTIKTTLATLHTREDITRYFSSIALEYTPGESWAYCTDAYVIAADILEKISGMTFESYIKKYIFQPLGLSSTFINPVFPASEPNAASYYLNTIGEPIAVPTPENKLGAPAGFIYSTANDLATYVIAQMDKRNNILSTTGRASMHAPIANRKKGLSYGLGWNIKNNKGLKIVEHAGTYLGVSSFVSMIPEQQFGMILLANMDQIQLMNVSNKIITTWVR